MISTARQVLKHHSAKGSNKMRSIYNEYGFVNIPGSGKNEFEDYMVFNLLDEDPTLL